MFVNSQKNRTIDATGCQILKLKCTKFAFREGSAPEPPEGAYSAPPDPYLYLRGLLLREGTERKSKEEGRGEEVQEGTWPTPKICVRRPIWISRLTYNNYICLVVFYSVVEVYWIKNVSL